MEYGIKQGNHLISMTTAIERAFEKGNIDYLLDVFQGVYDYDKGSVDNSTFVMTLRNKIKYEMEVEQEVSVADLQRSIKETVDKIFDMSTLASICGVLMAMKGGAA